MTDPKDMTELRAENARLREERDRLRDDLHDASRDYQSVLSLMEEAAETLAPACPGAFRKAIAELKSSATYCREVADAPSPTRYLTERLTDLERRVASAEAEARRLREALKEAAARFREYERGHLEKGQPIKAGRNAAMAAMCEAALAEPPGRAQEGE